jgi:hypothetical protein
MMSSELMKRQKKYPHATRYITAQGILDADKTTLETWEFEAQICDRVLDVFPEGSCPFCKGRVFVIGNKGIIVDFSVPFVHSFRVQCRSNRGALRSRWVQCTSCLVKRAHCNGIQHTWFGEICNGLIEKNPVWKGWLHVPQTNAPTRTYDHEAKP